MSHGVPSRLAITGHMFDSGRLAGCERVGATGPRVEPHDAVVEQNAGAAARGSCCRMRKAGSGSGSPWCHRRRLHTDGSCRSDRNWRSHGREPTDDARRPQTRPLPRRHRMPGRAGRRRSRPGSARAHDGGSVRRSIRRVCGPWHRHDRSSALRFLRSIGCEIVERQRAAYGLDVLGHHPRQLAGQQIARPGIG